MKTPHKHAELIKAWADGAEIEYSFAHDMWSPISVEPSWSSPNCLFRIKPEPTPDVVDFIYVSYHKANGMQFVRYREYKNLKLTFNGKTGKLKSAEVI